MGNSPKYVGKPLFNMVNTHCEDSGEPEPVTNRTGKYKYNSYFENSLGEQWVLQYDRETDKATLRGGDIRWSAIIDPLDEGSLQKWVLGADEQHWIKGCLLAIKPMREARELDTSREKD